MIESDFLTARELAGWLKVKLPTIRRWAREGLPCLRAGRLCRYEHEKVRAWLEQREQRRNGHKSTVSEEEK
jgi:excisionase family DNA binding protein